MQVETERSGAATVAQILISVTRSAAQLATLNDCGCTWSFILTSVTTVRTSGIGLHCSGTFLAVVGAEGLKHSWVILHRRVTYFTNLYVWRKGLAIEWEYVLLVIFCRVWPFVSRFALKLTSDFVGFLYRWLHLPSLISKLSQPSKLI